MPKRKDIKKILIIGAGPIVIGQACEFDYSGAQACKSLKEEGYEIVLINSHIASYKQASFSDHNPYDDRKLLLNKKEINKLIGKINREGFTLIPTKLYLKKGKAKIEIAVAKGKKKYDKRQTKKTRDWNRDKARYVRKSS